MKSIIAFIINIIISAICSALSYGFFVDTYDISVRVVDDNGAAVETAEVFISFGKNTTSGTKMFSQKGISNSDGRFKALGSGNGHIAYGATKNGFYDSYYSFYFPSYETQLKEYSLKRDFMILLRKIEKPVAMYARDTRRSTIEIPVVGKDVGFDLIAFDWVAPYGKGIESDFIFHLERLQVETRKEYDATLTISFPNKYDGIQSYRENLQYGSQLKLPRLAPEIGYEQKLVLHESFGSNIPTKYNFNFRADDLNYIFRVRSEEKDGKLEKAMYGKIVKYINFSAIGTKTAEIYFRYYLNPDYTRNLEFDTKHNLFGKLPDLERITEP